MQAQINQLTTGDHPVLALRQVGHHRGQWRLVQYTDP